MDVPQVTGLRAMLHVWRFLRDPVGLLRHTWQNHGDLLVIGPLFRSRTQRRHIIALGPEHNRAVFGDPATYKTTGQVRNGPPDSSMRRLRNGLTAMNGAKHRQQRQFLSPFFSKQNVDAYCRKLVDITGAQLAQWPTDEPVDLNALMHKLMLRLSAHVLFGREKRERLEEIGDMLHASILANLSPMAQVIPYWFPGSPTSRFLAKANYLEKILLTMIQERRDNPVPDAEGDMLDHLVQARDAENTPMTDADLLGQTTILFGASYETQSKAMTWACLLLAQHPRVMATLQRELAGVLHGRTPTLEELDQLPYLEAVLKEAMRILPPVPYTLRRATTDAPLGPITVHAGDWIVLSHLITHRHSEIYEHPDRFWPERWFTISPSQYEYVPFSAGPRWCIGKPLAMKMMKMTLATMAQKWTWQLAPRVHIDRLVRVTMGPKYGMPVMLHPQSNPGQAVPFTGDLLELADWIDSEPATAARTAA